MQSKEDEILQKRCFACRRYLSNAVDEHHLKNCLANVSLQKKIECKGCYCLVEVVKLFKHLNHKTVKCKASFTKAEIIAVEKLCNSRSKKDLQDNLPKNQETDVQPTALTECKVCHQNFARILAHIEQSRKCKNGYGEDELEKLKEDEKTFKCKGCNFVMKSDKLLIHLNHPNVKCKEAFSKEEYTLVYDLWMESKLSIKPLLQQRIKCRGCSYEIDKYNLIFHLNDKKVDCKKAYSKDEFRLVFEFWMAHQKSHHKRSLRELPCNVLLKCNGCEEIHLSGKMSNHVRSSKNCQGKYTNDERTSLNMLETDYIRQKKKEKDDERAELVANHYFKNLNESTPDFNEDDKPFYVDYGVIKTFVSRYWLFRDEKKSHPKDFKTPIAVLLGYKDNFGYHGKELLYLGFQGGVQHGKMVNRNSINIKTIEAIKNSKTFKEYKESAIVMMWMSSFSSKDLYFSGYDAHILCNWKKIYSNLVISMIAKVEADDYLQIGDYAFYDLNDLGKTSIKNCNITTKDEPQKCPHEIDAPLDTHYYKYKKVIITYSTSIAITQMNEHTEELTICEPTKPLLFDPRYFAKPEAVRPEPNIEHEVLSSEESDNDSKEKTSKTQSKLNVNDDGIPIEICKTCKKELAINTIMKHLRMKQDCKQQYSDEDLNALKTKISLFRNSNRRERRSKNDTDEDVVSELELYLVLYPRLNL